ncbi:unnamed protein product [Rhizoctonia solani]|uniref:Uncharacterized protein n=1 Tax=Rhizoctonia solani TaxID=456999 RepID=A0A8H3BNA3_9AGAM|nr:unnamed protein product [Rhizoctonia solani]
MQKGSNGEIYRGGLGVLGSRHSSSNCEEPGVGSVSVSSKLYSHVANKWLDQSRMECESLQLRVICISVEIRLTSNMPMSPVDFPVQSPKQVPNTTKPSFPGQSCNNSENFRERHCCASACPAL